MSPTIRIAAALILDGRERLLLVRKAGTRWFMQPGGKIEPGETPVAALRRELAEEIGIDIDRHCVVELGRFSAPAANEAGYKVDAEVYLVPCPSDFSVGAEIAESTWASYDEAMALPLAPLTRDRMLPLSRSALVKESLIASAAAPRPAPSPPPPRR